MLVCGESYQDIGGSGGEFVFEGLKKISADNLLI